VVDKEIIERYVRLLEDPGTIDSLIDRVERKAKGNG
jgi:hypothetical protein